LYVCEGYKDEIQLFAIIKFCRKIKNFEYRFQLKRQLRLRDLQHILPLHPHQYTTSV